MILFTYRGFPPSSNRLYFRNSLTTVARKYAEDFSKFMMQNYGHMLQPGIFEPDRVYALHLRFFFPTIINETWNNPAVKASKRAKERYKRFDLDNRIKLLTDCIRDFVGVDDSHFLVGTQEKHMDPTDPRIEMYIQQVREEDFGVPPVQQGILL
jgi:Holliday junction resolvase RusA-like endonuclease